MVTSKLKDCPTRPECPNCGMAMVTIERTEHKDNVENCKFECLRCGHVEVSEPAEIGRRRTG
jgi:transcription elongation factor Elf1